MFRGAPFAIAGLIALVSWGTGGYDPWAILALELGALALAGAVFLPIVLGTRREDRERFLAIRRSQKKGSTEVEIVEPSPDGSAAATLSHRDPFYWMGFPFRRNGLGLVLLLLTLWIVLSILPLPGELLSILSPKALAVRTEAEALLGREPGFAPWSVTPYLTFQDLLLWTAFVLLFLVTHHVASSRTAVRRLSLSLLLIGVVSGGYGLGQWLLSLGSTAADGFQTTGSFGNRNHFAVFQEMLLLVAIGWLAMRRRDRSRPADDPVAVQEEKAKDALLLLGAGIIGLSLLFSLSRSGITFAAAGGVLFLYLTSRARRSALALLTALAVAALWIGIDPVVSRFELVSDDLAGEGGRTAVWRDSLGALRDFWLTGSGSSSFQYVYPIYRSFGGRRFYSWAHNDYLQIAIELGLPGLALSAALMIGVARRAREVRRKLSEAGSSMRELHAGYCAAALAVALHSFTDFGLHLPANAALLAVIVALVTGISPSRAVKKGSTESRKKLRRAPPLRVADSATQV